MFRLFISFLSFISVLFSNSFSVQPNNKIVQPIKSLNTSISSSVSNSDSSDTDVMFAEDSVVVILTFEASLLNANKELELEQLFQNINYESYFEIFTPSIFNENSKIEKDNKKAIFLLKLATHSKEYVRAVVNILNKNKYVYKATPDYYAKPMYSTPSDRYFSSQWGLNGDYGIDIQNAWNITTGVSSVVTVGVIDSGIRNHDDLRNNLLSGYDYVNDELNTYDDVDGHGTNVAGIIAAENNDIGIVGVAPNVKLIPFQVTIQQNGEAHSLSTRVISSIYYATSLWGTDQQISVLNYSYGNYGKEEGAAILAAAVQFPGLFVWSVGNDGENIDTNFIEDFDSSNIISVGAINTQGEKWPFSNYGDFVNVFAPGDYILTTSHSSSYVYAEGTSMAAPFVSGVAALLYSKYPYLSNSEVKQSLIFGSSYFSYQGNDNTFYPIARRLNATGSLNYAFAMFGNHLAPLRLSNQGKNGSVWSIKLFNPNESTVYAAYNKKMCYTYDARTFSGLTDIEEITIGPLQSSTVTISENGLSGFITASIGYSRQSITTYNYRVISSTNNLMVGRNDFGQSVFTCRDIRNTNYKEIQNEPSYLMANYVSSNINSIKIRVTNSNNYRIDISYNSKLCFMDDAKKYNVLDSVQLTLEPNETKELTINKNYFADYLTAKINYFYHGAARSRITYAKANSTMTNSHNRISYY